jgi:glycosyltransferase involved in cell wall biosynthesis
MSKVRRKLCIVTPTHWKALMGGAQYQVKCLLDALIPLDRYEIYYLARRVAPDYGPEGYQLTRIGRGRSTPRLGFLMDAMPLYNALRRISPDVIYQRVGCGYTGIAAYYARRQGSRLIWHISHDTDVVLDRLPGEGNPVRHFLEKRAIEYGIRHARHIVAQTEHQASLLKMNYGRTVDAVVPNFHPAPNERIDKSGPLTVLWVANLKPWKQPEAFVRLAQALVDLPAVQFVMVGGAASGPGAQEWNEELLRNIQATPNLRYLGPKSQEEVNELMARAHLFVNTSLDEGFANTFIQAWMRCVPVMSLHIDPDGVLNRESVGVHAGSVERLALTVRNLLMNSAEREALAGNARDYAMRVHSVRNARLLQRLIDTGRADTAEPGDIAESGEAPVFGESSRGNKRT